MARLVERSPIPTSFLEGDDDVPADDEDVQALRKLTENGDLDDNDAEIAKRKTVNFVRGRRTL